MEVLASLWLQFHCAYDPTYNSDFQCFHWVISSLQMQMYFWSLLLYTWKVQQPNKRFYLTNCSAAWVRTRGENQRPEIHLCLLAKLWALFWLAYDFSSSQWKPALRKLIWEFLTTNFNPPQSYWKANQSPTSERVFQKFEVSGGHNSK